MVFIQRLIADHMPAGIKRLLCLSTLGYRIQQLTRQKTDRTFYSKMNALLDLAENEGALRFAVCYTNVLWRDVLKIDKEHVDNMVDQLYQSLPSYLKYQSKEVVEAEMKKVILSFA